MSRAVSLCSAALVAAFVAGCSADEVARDDGRPSGRADASTPGAIQGSASPARALRGTWDHTFTGADAHAVLSDFSDYVQKADRVVARLGFVDEDTWWLGFLFDGKMVLVDGVPEGDGGTYTVTSDHLVTTGKHGEARVTYSWSLTGQTLTLRAIEECALYASTPTHCEQNRAKMDPRMLLATEHAFTRSGDRATY